MSKDVSIHATLAGGDSHHDHPRDHPRDVSIHATLAGGDIDLAGILAQGCVFLSTPPSRVATEKRSTRTTRKSSFYPRHPRGWRLLSVWADAQRVVVSIHATLAGGDSTISRLAARHFSFLSTPPSRVATGHSLHHIQPAFVSIHATLAGGDVGVCLLFPPVLAFLSTPPSRVATRVAHNLLFLLSAFLSTPPSRVATQAVTASSSVLHNVSIHATLAGGDLQGIAEGHQKKCFYPRHPRGWRLNTITSEKNSVHVSIHATLAGGDGGVICKHSNGSTFLSTPPSRVATSTDSCSLSNLSCFYPRHPRGWRLRQGLGGAAGPCVSIHATLAGGDVERARIEG